MRVVLVSSPGEPGGCHWSHAVAAELARVLAVAGVGVEWFCVGRAASAPPPGTSVHQLPESTAPLHRVIEANDDPALEAALARSLRAHHAKAVVHIGTGARGSPNVLWLADRMGSAVFGVVHATEVLCHRGTLVDATGAPCTIHDEAPRCQRCCTRTFLQRPRAMAFEDRWDLLLGGLAVAAAVFVPNPHDAQRLAHVGVPKRVLVATHDVEAIAARVLGRPVTAARS